jgi:oxygen-independent coproporphyrinogen III oxidase
MRPETVRKFASRVPRYTSYPTAQSFTTEIGATDYRNWLSEVAPDERVSLYTHIPFCETLCWYCGCTTKMVKRYDPVKAYLNALTQEIANVSKQLGRRQPVSHLHWGGGSPNILSPGDIRRLAQSLRHHFDVLPDTEFAVEIDPRQYEPEKIQAFVDAGVTRVSLGVQDFDRRVQEAINRLQSFDDTKLAVDAFRAAGIRSLNIDLVYGLPHQTRASVMQTIDQVLELSPDRVALFGYAHLPSRIPHQRQIPEAALPDSIERYAQASRAAHHLQAAGYVRIGMDHFAKPDDPLACHPVHRNFQGYTSDGSDTLIGLGASAIGSFRQGYAQNAVPTGHYIQAVTEHGLATVRGVALSDDDRARALAINRLMCDMRFPVDELRKSFGPAGDALVSEAQALLQADDEQLLEPEGDGFTVTEKGRPFVRSVCACFDAYFGSTPETKFSTGI